MPVEKSVRLLGAFQLTQSNSFPSKTSPRLPFGALEIFHAPYNLPGGREIGSFVRWTKLESADDLASLQDPGLLDSPEPKHNAFIKEFDAYEKLKALQTAGDSLSFWICNPSKTIGGDTKLKGRILYFHGAVVFDQFDSEGTLDRRLPCVPVYTNTWSDKGHTSRFIVGNGDKAFDFRVEIALPLPLPIGVDEVTKDGKGTGALGVGGLYASALKKSDKVGYPDGIFTGSSGEVFYQLSKRTVRIGDFGFSGDGGKPEAGRDFVRYAIGRKGLTNMGQDLGMAAGRLLAKLGHDGGKHIKSRKHNNIEFQTVKEKDHWVYSIVCRRRIEPPDLDLSVDLGGVLPGPDHLDVEIGFSCLFADKDIVPSATAPDPVKLNAEAQIRLHWTDKQKLSSSGFFGTGAKPEILEIGGNGKIALHFGGIQEAVRLMNATRKSLLPSKSQPQSFFPALAGYPNKRSEVSAGFVAYIGKLEASFSLRSSQSPGTSEPVPVKLEFDRRQTIDWPSKDVPTRPASMGITLEPAVPSKELWLLRKEWKRPPDPSPPLQLKAYFESVNRIEQPDSDKHIHLELSHDKRAMQASGAVGSFAIRNSAKQEDPHGRDKTHWGQFRARLGSLDFEERAGHRGLLDDQSKNSNSLTLRRRGRTAYDNREIAVGQPTMDVELKLTLQLGDVRPVTVDIPHGDRMRPRADLLIDEYRRRSKEQGETKFLLQVTERLRDDEDWHLVARLFERDATGTDERRSYTVIGEQPFSIYRYSRLPLESSGDEGQAQVAEWDSDRREWRYGKVSELYHFTFPPAVTGESADKPRRLEIHDPVDPNTHSPKVKLKAGDPEPPWETTYLVDSRFSPTTEIWTKPEDLLRNFFLPEHAGRALFNQRGAFGPGMELAGLRGELLYAMPFGVNVPEPDSAVPRPRIAELSALTGRMVMVEQRDDPSNTRKRWNALRETMLTRPQRLEAWTLDPRRANPFVPAKFDEGVNFSLRRTALLKPPVRMEADERVVPRDVAVAPPRLAEHGLAGGALWPLESRNYVEAIRSQPQGTGGSLEKFAISPHGGSGDQTAEFLNGNVKIISETRNGFVQKQRVEILGRIAALWHRAKHVVIYERTTSPSAQFAPEVRADTRTERPVLRKVDEFVEILEPVRRYPDFDGFAKATTGFLEEVRYNSRVIRVNSAWGQDVGTIGWQVPLWNRGEARIRPRVYPYPDIAFATLGEGSDERPLAIQECLDADNLFFFADAESARKTSDTDAWLSRDKIDFTSLRSAAYLADKVDEAGFDPAAKRRPAASRILPGLRRFTWRLAPATTGTQINAAIGDKPVFAGLDTVTFMRSQPDNIDPKTDQPIDQALNTRLKAAQGSDLMGVEGTPPCSFADDTSLPQTLKNYVKDQADFADAVDGLSGSFDKNAANQAVTKLRDRFLVLKQNNGADLLGALDNHFGSGRLVAAVSKVIGDNDGFLKELDTFDEGSCERLKKRIERQVNSRKLLLVEHTKVAQRDLIERMDKILPDLSPDRQKLFREAIVAELSARTDAIFDQARQDVGDIFENIEKARAIVADWKDDAQTALRRARARVDAWHAAYERDKPWSRNRIDRAARQLQDEIAAVEEEASAALEEMRQRLSSDIDSVAATLTTRISRIMAHVLSSAASAKAKTGEIEGMLAHHVKPITSALGKVTATGAGSYDEQVRKVLEKLDDKIPSLTGTKKDLAEKARDTLKAKWPDVQSAAATTDQELQKVHKSANEALAQINATIDAAKTAADTELTKVKDSVKVIKDSIVDLADNAGEEIEKDLGALSAGLSGTVDGAANALKDLITDLKFPDILDGLVADTRDWLTEGLQVAEFVSTEGTGVIDAWLALKKAEFDKSADAVNLALKSAVKTQVIEPAVSALLAPLSEQDWRLDQKYLSPLLEARLNVLADEVLRVIEAGALSIGELNDAVNLFCNELAGLKASIWNAATSVADRFRAELEKELNPYIAQAEKFLNDAAAGLDELKDLLDTAKAIDEPFNDLVNQVGEGAEYARAYLDRAIDLAGSLTEGGFKSGPNNALKLYAAVFQSPEIAALRANMDRMRGTFQRIGNLVKTSKAKAIFEKLGDALKAMGIDLPFDALGDKFRLDEEQLDNLQFRDIFGNFGGLDISQIAPDFGGAGGLSEYVDVSHDFDKKAVRAWVQIDVSVPINGRRKLFSIGPFTLYFRDSLLDGFVRLEASKDTDEVSTTDLAIIQTNIEAVVGGQVMVTLQDVQLVYTKASGLDFVFDAKKIKLNPTFRFIQDTLGRLFGDELGGLKLIKQNGIPVGLEHTFNIPPVSLMFGTSGVSNIQISNRFALVAYPEFVISDRFNLSTRELPFLFSIFIIGGTGYILVETEYRPFDGELMVVVEAAAGGSAALGFAFGPVAGSVFISLSVALRYQKRLGSGPDGGSGLTVSLVLVIAGNVSLWGMVHIYLGLMLAMNYHESGQIDGVGTLTVELRISRWFKLKYSTTVRYKLRNGQATKQVSSSTELGGEKFKEIQAKAEALKKARKKL